MVTSASEVNCLKIEGARQAIGEPAIALHPGQDGFQAKPSLAKRDERMPTGRLCLARARAYSEQSGRHFAQRSTSRGAKRHWRGLDAVRL
jgi:hypothetical protein